MVENISRTVFKNINSPEGLYTLMFDVGCWPQLTQSQFSASGYVDVQPVSGRGGRGSAWFVETPCGPAILKRYSRGGMVAKLVADRYVFLGDSRVRSFREFTLLHILRELNLPVPKPLAAFCLLKFGTYRAALVTQRIAGARSLVDAILNGGDIWQDLGARIAQFHLAGAHHSDLNAQNILINEQGELFLIDWDKGVLETGVGEWCAKVLDRLQRSVLKECKQIEPQFLHHGLQQMRSSYQQAMS